MEKYLWASNPAKVVRAEKELKSKGLEITDEAVKEIYIKYGGYVLTEDEVNEKVEIALEEAQEKPRSRKYAK